ncbi:MAG: hypothetical protein L3J76_03090 [Candidatus Hydrothermae bacterium]|nr:hypothetical protein [Candidatus Hydrothermae bacterium]
MTTRPLHAYPLRMQRFRDSLRGWFSLILLVGALSGTPSSLPGEGDQTLWATDFRESPPAGLIPDLDIRRGALEIHRGGGRRWLRPRVLGTGAVLPLSLPEAFSFAFTFQTHADGNPYLRIFLHTPEGMRNWGSYGGPRVLEIRISREGPVDVVRLYTRDTPFVEPIPPQGERRVPADTPHRVLLVIRDGAAHLWVDEHPVTTVKFHPTPSLAGLGWSWYRTYDTHTPFSEASVWITELRLAAYSQPSHERFLRARAVLLLRLDTARVPDTLLKTWIRPLQGKVLPEGIWIPFPRPLFHLSGSWTLNTPPPASWIQKLRKLMVGIRQRDPGAVLVAIGRSPESNGVSTSFWDRQVPNWLAALRAREVFRWLVTAGLDPAWIRTRP